MSCQVHDRVQPGSGIEKQKQESIALRLQALPWMANERSMEDILEEEISRSLSFLADLAAFFLFF